MIGVAASIARRFRRIDVSPTTLESLAERVEAIERIVARLDTALTIDRLDRARRAVETEQPAQQPMTFAERYKDVIGKVEGLPEDAASNVDFYLRNGLPKLP